MTSIEQLKARIKQRQAEWLQRWFARHSGPRDNKMYHYTDASGLLGILRNRTFWATNITHLNDSSELEHGIALVRQRLDEAARRRGSGKVAVVLAAIRENFHSFGLLAAYVSCFCEDGDLLSQWRGYGSAGGGYAVGISPSGTRTNLPPEPKISCRQAIYEKSEKLGLIDDSIKALEQFADEVFAGTSTDWNEAATQLTSFFRQEVGDYLWCFKDEAFREEKEWRYCYITGPADPAPRPLFFRPALGGLVPYVELDLFNLRSSDKKHLEVSEVVCGPTLDPVRSVATVESLLGTLKYKDVNVTPSRVPLRR